jgi:hypothetical protein
MNDMHSDRRRSPILRGITRTAAAAVVAVALLASGCQLLLLGGAAGAGAGAASYYLGKLEKTVEYDVPETHEAAVSALKSMELPVMQDRSDRISAHVESEFADGKPVWIDIEATGENDSRITIRVGYVGDRDRAMRILDAMEDRLGEDSEAPRSPGGI